MSRSEVLSPEGLRLDGRRPGEIRRLRCQLSAEPKADGSAYLEQGNTKVLVTVTGPHEVSSQRKAQHDRAVLHCTYAALPFSAGQHKNPSRTADSELASSVRSVFDPVVQTQLYPRTQIDVSITLLQADGLGSWVRGHGLGRRRLVDHHPADAHITLRMMIRLLQPDGGVRVRALGLGTPNPNAGAAVLGARVRALGLGR